MKIKVEVEVRIKLRYSNTTRKEKVSRHYLTITPLEARGMVNIPANNILEGFAEEAGFSIKVLQREGAGFVSLEIDKGVSIQNKDRFVRLVERHCKL